MAITNIAHGTTGAPHHHLTSSPAASAAPPRRAFGHDGRRSLLMSSAASSPVSHPSNRRKWNLSTIIRTIYWAVFVLLVLTTFLRTTVVSNGLLREEGVSSHSNGGTPGPDSIDDRPDVHKAFHQRIRGTNIGGAGETFDDGASTSGRVLPGLHNPHSPVFGSSEEMARRRNAGGTNDRNNRSDPRQLISSGRGTTPAPQNNNNNNNNGDDSNPHRQVAGGNADKSVNWWAVLNKVDGQNGGYSVSKKYYLDGSSSSSSPPSDFVKKLLRLEQELMFAANSTAANGRRNQERRAAPPVKRTPPARPPPDQPVDFLPPILPPPRTAVRSQGNQEGGDGSNNTGSSNGSGSGGSGSGMVVLVLSHQGSFLKRQAIRETWANRTKSQVFFVVAQSNCREFERDRGGGLSLEADLDDEDGDGGVPEVASVDEDGRDPDRRLRRRLVQERRRRGKPAGGVSNSTQAAATKSSSSLPRLTCDEIDHNFLRLEQELYQDLLEIPMGESYKRLPEKLLQAYHWVLTNLPHVEWIVKADDDMMVRVDSLERYLRKYNSQIPMLIGQIVYHALVARFGKWAETDYREDYYPFWPKGSAGHVVSRAAAKYFTDMSESLHRYQGEDVSIGIWLDDARKNGALKDVTYIHANHMFTSEGKHNCERHKYMIIGHDFHPDELLACHNRFDGIFPEVAWLDDPSEFDDMIRQEESPDYWAGRYGDKGGTWLGSSSGYNTNKNMNNQHYTNDFGVKSGSSFGYRATAPIFEETMQ